MTVVDSSPLAHCRDAVAHARAGRWAEALDCADAALACGPGFEAALLLRARAQVQLDRLQPAREAFAALLRRHPGNYSGWLELGHLCRRLGQAALAMGAYQRAIDVDGDRYEAPLAMARSLEEAGRHDVAERAAAHALEAGQRRSPATACEVHRRLGRWRVERGELARALPALRAALALAGDDDAAELRIDIAELLLRALKHEAGLEQLQQAATSTREATLARAAELAYRFNHWPLAIEWSRRSLALYPGSAWAHWNLAQLLADCWQMDEAETLLQQAEAIAPMPRAAALRAAIASRRGDADTALAIYCKLHAQTPSGEYAASAAMTSLYSDRLKPAAVARLHRELFEPLGQGARPRAGFQRGPLAGRRVRLGFVSGDFHRQHPVDIFMQPVLRELDRTRFEVFLYADGATNDEQTRLARSRVEHWRDVCALNDRQLAARIDADGIDLLVDLAGHTSRNRMRLFGHRAAPVQCTYLGYPGSTGVPNMDWMFGDAVVTPAGSEALYSERIARLPDTVYCYAPETDYPYPAFSTADAGRPLTFGCFNNVPKLTPRTLRLWASILVVLPEARLLLKAPSFADRGAAAVFRDRLQALGVAPDRLELRGPSALPDMMAEYAEVDIALDPVPYNGGTTTAQAMWMGAPVVTLEGGHFVSRMASSWMRAAGLPDWVATDDDGYVAIAVERGRDRQALLALKQSLRDRLKARPAWDPARHTRAMEAAWLAMLGPGASRGSHLDKPLRGEVERGDRKARISDTGHQRPFVGRCAPLMTWPVAGAGGRPVQ